MSEPVTRTATTARPGLLAGMIAALGLAAAVLLLASLTGWPESAFPVAAPEPGYLSKGDLSVRTGPLGEDVTVGETVTYRVQIRYPEDSFTPDVDLLTRSTTFQPLDVLRVEASERGVGGGLTELTLDYILQAVEVTPGAAYPLEPIRVHALDQAGGEPATFPREPVQVGSLYPADVAEVPLRPEAGAVIERVGWRRGLALAAALLALGATAALLWQALRVRRVEELSEPERLWQELQAAESLRSAPRLWLLQAERIFTRLLRWKTGLAPEAFWAGVDPDDESMTEPAREARAAMSSSYRREAGLDVPAERMHAMLTGLLQPLVDAARLEREAIPGARERLRRQPRVLAVAGLGATACAVLIGLALFPDVWIGSEIARYNTAVRAAEAEERPQRRAELFADAADRLETPRLKAAALYSAATSRAHMPTTLTGTDEAELLRAAFQQDEPILSFLDDQESIDMLLDGARAHQRAERELQDAIRLDADNRDAQRNLELVGKRSRALSARVQELFDQASASPSAQGDGVVDVLNMKMPDEYKLEDKGKDDSNYFVLEKF